MSRDWTDLVSTIWTDFMLLIAEAFHYPSFPDLLLTAFKLFPPLTKLIIHVSCSHRSARLK